MGWARCCFSLLLLCSGGPGPWAGLGSSPEHTELPDLAAAWPWGPVWTSSPRAPSLVSHITDCRRNVLSGADAGEGAPWSQSLSLVRPRLQLPLCSGGPPCVWSPSICSRRPQELAPCELTRSRTQCRVGNGAQGGRWAARVGPPALLLTRRGPPHLLHRDAVGLSVRVLCPSSAFSLAPPAGSWACHRSH